MIGLHLSFKYWNLQYRVLVSNWVKCQCLFAKNKGLAADFEEIPNFQIIGLKIIKDN